MHAESRFAIVALVTVLATASPALGWNTKGHMAVACIAYDRLTPPTRARVDDLLRRNPSYSAWAKAIPPTVSDTEKRRSIFMKAAMWADRIKTRSDYRDDGTENGSQPNGASSSQNTGYSDHLRHRYWHFVTVPFSRDRSPLPPVSTPNAEDRIDLFRTVLASTSEPDDLKSYDLTWLLHLVGDIHQPLHVATRVSASQPDGDRNGSRVRLCRTPCTYDLRAFWNTILGPETSVIAAERLADTLADPPAADAAVLDQAIWVRDELDIAKKEVYISPIGAGAGPFTVTANYRSRTRLVARQQVALAGARLANILNAELK